MANKINELNLREEIAKIAKEEFSSLVEQVNPQFEKLSSSQKDKFIDWVLRQYFADKNKTDIWYDPSVDEDNVLEYISNPATNFPLSPKQIVNMYKTIRSLRGSMNSPAVERDLNRIGLSDDEDEGEETASKRQGDVTYKDLGKEIGVSHTMINRIFDRGAEKMQKIFGGNPATMDPQDLEDSIKRIKKARNQVASKFASLISSMEKEEDLRDLAAALKKDFSFTKSDFKSLSDLEIESLFELSELSADEIEKILLADIQRSDNLFKSFQLAVANTVFEPPKRGRPRKS